MKCKGRPGQFTCQANADVKESRIDYFFTNDRLTPAVTACYVDYLSGLHTHRPLLIEVATAKLEMVTKEMQKPADLQHSSKKRCKRKSRRSRLKQMT